MAHVAPYAGAWIETSIQWVLIQWRGCRPLRGGVDRNGTERRRRSRSVGRPLRGGVDRNSRSSIFMSALHCRPLRGGVDRNNTHARDIAVCQRVAPYAGAWIETRKTGLTLRSRLGRPLRGGVDRNINPMGFDPVARVSPPTRGRGSKLIQWRGLALFAVSPPTRGRGSKLKIRRPDGPASGRPLRGGVDRNDERDARFCALVRRPLRGGVDRNHARRKISYANAVAPYAGAWIETSTCHVRMQSAAVAPYAGAWIETKFPRRPSPMTTSRPLRGGVDRNDPMGLQSA